MALHWDATDVKGWDSFDETEKDNCANFAWVLMAIDMGKVTEDNVAEVWSRMNLLEGLGLINGPDKNGYTRKHVVSYIGFYTNVTTMTLHTWLTKKVKRYMTQRIERQQKLIVKARELV